MSHLGSHGHGDAMKMAARMSITIRIRVSFLFWLLLGDGLVRRRHGGRRRQGGNRAVTVVLILFPNDKNCHIITRSSGGC